MQDNICQDVTNIITLATMTGVIIPVTLSNIDFSDWLIGELESRGWSQSDLARAAGINPSSISHLVNRTRFPGNEMCRAIAKAFGYPPDAVFRAAGLLPASKDMDEETEKMMHLFEQMTPEDQEMLIGMAQVFIDRRGQKSRPARAEG